MRRQAHTSKVWTTAAALLAPTPVFAQPQGDAWTTLSGEIELARLVDLSAERLGLKVEYDAKALQGATVTLRLAAPVDDAGLWALTNQLMAGRGFTSVQRPGDEVLSIVKLADAAGAARVEPSLPPSTKAGYTAVVVAIQHVPTKEVIDAITPMLSKPGGAVTALGAEPRILLSDLRPRIDQVLELIDAVDVAAADTVVQQVPAGFLEASQLASVVTAAVTARNALEASPLRGRLTPLPDGSAVVLVAPGHELPEWLDLIKGFDQRQAVVTRSYAPRHFSITEVGRLLEETGRDQGPGGAGDRWRVVTDELTGTLVVTATPSEQDRVQALVDRLDAVSVEARRPVRAFRIRNRGVNEILE